MIFGYKIDVGFDCFSGADFKWFWGRFGSQIGANLESKIGKKTELRNFRNCCFTLVKHMFLRF